MVGVMCVRAFVFIFYMCVHVNQVEALVEVVHVPAQHTVVGQRRHHLFIVCVRVCVVIMGNPPCCATAQSPLARWSSETPSETCVRVFE